MLNFCIENKISRSNTQIKIRKGSKFTFRERAEDANPVEWDFLSSLKTVSIIKLQESKAEKGG